MRKRIIKSAEYKGTEADTIIAELTGTDRVSPIGYLINQEAKEEYWAIVGGFAYPENRKPGFGVIVGVLKTDDEPVFKVLAEVENPALDGLFKNYAEICNEWGLGEGYFGCVYGDPERYIQSYSNFLQETDRKFYLADAADIKTPNNTPIYLQTLLSCGMPESVIRLSFGTCNRLDNYMKNFPVEVKRIEEYPPVAALAYAIHSLLNGKPWERPAEGNEKPNELDTMWNDGEVWGFHSDRPIWE
jgi:hypothetical protein